jgi:hypothetical protein
MHDASCNLKNTQLHNVTITLRGSNLQKAHCNTSVLGKTLSENNTYMIQAPLQSQMPITQKTLKFASYKSWI